MGSKYFIISAAWTYDPKPLSHALTTLRYSLVRQGKNIELFHACEDKQATRNLVVGTLLAHTGWNFAAVVMEKRKVNPVLREPGQFYPQFTGVLLKFILRGSIGRGASNVLVYADTMPMTVRKREGAIKAMKTRCAMDLQAGVGHHVFSHASASNPWLQVVDYCCWGLSRKYERGDTRTYDSLRPRLQATELVITASGDQKTYY